MPGTAVIDQARLWANGLLQMESRGPGDLESAMHRIERQWGIPVSVLWSLRYRPPKDIGASLMISLMQAHEAMCERQKARYEHELAVAKAKGGVPSLLHRLAVAVAGQSDNGEA